MHDTSLLRYAVRWSTSPRERPQVTLVSVPPQHHVGGWSGASAGMCIKRTQHLVVPKSFQLQFEGLNTETVYH